MCAVALACGPAPPAAHLFLYKNNGPGIVWRPVVQAITVVAGGGTVPFTALPADPSEPQPVARPFAATGGRRFAETPHAGTDEAVRFPADPYEPYGRPDQL
jgi:hypothetical protein